MTHKKKIVCEEAALKFLCGGRTTGGSFSLAENSNKIRAKNYSLQHFLKILSR
jgi:hypothetical protein